MAVALVIQHVEVEGPALLGDALRDRGCDLDIRHAYRGEPIPSNLGTHDALVVLGGPMSAGSDDGFPTRRAELNLIADALRQVRPTLGICLGAQLLAVVAGSSVARGPHPEIGFGYVHLTTAARTDALFSGLPPEVPVLHWHSETFEVPTGGLHLAASASYESQAYRLGALAWGLQFHVEIDRAALDRIAAAFPHEANAIPGGAATVLSQADDALPRMSTTRAHVLGRFADLVLSQAGGL